MKERLLELIKKTDEIEKLFHTTPVAPGIAMVASESIYDVQEFRIWLQELKCELQEIHDRTHNTFIWQTINDLSANFNGWHDRDMFNKVKGDLIAIKNNIDNYYPNSAPATQLKNKEVSMTKKPKIFISHSTLDKKYAEKLVELFEAMGLNEQTVFCSSVPGYDIMLGGDIYEHLRKLFQEHELHIVYLLSKHFYNSPASLNEMGAAWVLKNVATSILLPEFGFNDMKGVVDNREIAIKLDDTIESVKDKLNQLYENIITEFSLGRKRTIIWERKRDAFIRETIEINENEKLALENDKEIKLSHEAEEILLNATKKADALIIVISNLSGKCIQAGMETYSSSMGAREFSKWDAGFDELHNKGYIKAMGKKNEVFQVTDKGFTYIEEKFKRE